MHLFGAALGGVTYVSSRIPSHIIAIQIYSMRRRTSTAQQKLRLHFCIILGLSLARGTLLLFQRQQPPLLDVFALGFSPRRSSATTGSSSARSRPSCRKMAKTCFSTWTSLPRRVRLTSNNNRRASWEGYEMIEDVENNAHGREYSSRNPTTSSTALSMTSNTRGGGDGQAENDVEGAEEQSKLRGRAILLLVAFLYGTLNVVLRQLYATPGPPAASMLSATRGWLAVACFLPAIGQIRTEVANSSTEKAVIIDREKQASLLVVAAELAFWNFSCQGLVNVGLLFTESARAAFLTQTSVVITPLISMIVLGESVGRNVWVGCASALAGLVLLSADGSGDAVSSTADGIVGGFGLSFGAGDLLVLGGAVCWSIYIIRTSQLGNRYPEVSLQAIKSVALAIMYSTWLAFSAWRCFYIGGWDGVAGLWLGWQNLAAWGLLAYSAIGPGALADVLQQNGQKEVSASEANVILCSEPIWTAILAFLIAGETTTAMENAGGALVVLGAIFASL